mmetsp:Transcript_5953/g.17901  ORF Transcript_5953/g.17901 Transcript_5953/m.17901 type:complete len:211 (-) Transcript_5953:119-751(-)
MPPRLEGFPRPPHSPAAARAGRPRSSLQGTPRTLRLARDGRERHTGRLPTKRLNSAHWLARVPADDAPLDDGPWLWSGDAPHQCPGPLGVRPRRSPPAQAGQGRDEGVGQGSKVRAAGCWRQGQGQRQEEEAAQERAARLHDGGGALATRRRRRQGDARAIQGDGQGGEGGGGRGGGQGEAGRRGRKEEGRGRGQGGQGQGRPRKREGGW